jgi:hypothetical protein
MQTEGHERLQFYQGREENFDPHQNEWMLTDDASIDTEAIDECKLPSYSGFVVRCIRSNFCTGGVELVSPALVVNRSSTLYRAVEEALQFLSNITVMTIHESCGLHFHVSLQGHEWQLRYVKRVACAVLWFEPATEVLVPDDRRRNEYCRSHRANSPALLEANPNPYQALDLVTNCQTLQALVTLMTGTGDESKYFSVNFRNFILADRNSTIEFRRAPPSVDATEVNCWAEFTMAFVQSALAVDEFELRLHPQRRRPQGVSEPRTQH